MNLIKYLDHDILNYNLKKLKKYVLVVIGIAFITANIIAENSTINCDDYKTNDFCTGDTSSYGWN